MKSKQILKCKIMRIINSYSILYLSIILTHHCLTTGKTTTQTACMKDEGTAIEPCSKDDSLQDR